MEVGLDSGQGDLEEGELVGSGEQVRRAQLFDLD